MDFIVKKLFSDTELGKLFFPNHVYQSEDYERVKYLIDLGFLYSNDNINKLEKQEAKEVEVKEEKPKTTRKRTTKKASDADAK